MTVTSPTGIVHLVYEHGARSGVTLCGVMFSLIRRWSWSGKNDEPVGEITCRSCRSSSYLPTKALFAPGTGSEPS